jgi:hypothetical protein
MLLDDIQAFLQDDDELTELLTGGLHITTEISRQLTPTAFDENAEIKPSALIKTGNETGIGPFTDSVQTPIVIYLYQRAGYDVIEAADQLIFDLLQRTKVGSATWMIEFDSTLNRQWDDALQCPMLVTRYHATRRKV